MANVKISNLTAATTPVAGTEVLPIVQSSATVKVSIANLTAGRSVSATGLALTGSTSGTVTLTAKAVAGSTTFKLPSADGTSNQAMVTDGSGNLSFATVGAGDVVGPASATANGVALFNSTTGKLIKDSAASDGLIYGLTVGRGAGAVGSNTALGVSALAANTSGVNSTAIGYQALKSNTSGFSHTAVGYGALSTTVTGVGSTAVGQNAGAANTSGVVEAFGVSALTSNTTGTANQAFGSGGGGLNAPLQLNTTGSNNQAYGTGALGTNTTGGSNVALGSAALYSNTTGTNHTAVGYQAGYDITGVAIGNTCIGNGAGSTLTTGSYNVYIGYTAKPSSATVNTELVICTGTAYTGKGTNTGFIQPNTGGVYQGNNSSTWSTTSDRRLKKNIVDNTVGLDAITSIRVRNFEYRLPEEVDAELKPSDAIEKPGVQLGVIAQELQQVLPDCIKTESTGVMSVNADNLTWYMVNAIKELSAKVQALEAQIKGA